MYSRSAPESPRAGELTLALCVTEATAGAAVREPRCDCDRPAEALLRLPAEGFVPARPRAVPDEVPVWTSSPAPAALPAPCAGLEPAPLEPPPPEGLFSSCDPRIA